ncbi:MAG: hypothetical protein KAH95_17825 [Spirochaetales bacterium]|nr:hypothetical protein [Spirochaetales bacterium]
MTIKKIISILLLILILLPHGFAQELGEFEESFNKEQEKEVKDSEEKHENRDDDSDSVFGKILFKIIGKLFWYTLIAGGAYSYERMQPEYNSYVYPRIAAEPLIAILRSDTSFQIIDQELFALDQRVEIGYGPFGAAGRYSYYFETDSPSELHLWQAHLLYRMSILNLIELSPGIGGFGMFGQYENDGLSLTAPIRVNIDRTVSLEILPVLNIYPNGSTGSDLDIAVLLDFQQVKPRFGYRQLSSSGGTVLKGFYGGVTFVY